MQPAARVAVAPQGAGAVTAQATSQGPLRRLVARGQLLWVLVAAAASLVLWQLGSGIPLGLVPFVIVGIAASAVAALVVARRPENAIGWILAVVGVTAGLALVAGGYVDYSLAAADGGDLATDAATWLAGVAEPVAFQLVVVFLFLFPDGRLPSRRWRWVAVPAAVAIGISLLSTAFAPWPLAIYSSGAAVPTGVDNPLAPPGAAGEVIGAIQGLAFAVVLVAIPVAAASMVFRYRTAQPQKRQQIKWIALAGALVVLAIVVGDALHTAGVSRWTDEDSIPVLLCVIAIATIPIAAGIAILHHRLYDVDRIINRTLTYGLLTAGLGAVYFGLVVGLQAALQPLSGGSNLAIAVTTLLVAALFLPVRRRVQNGVDRRFNRRGYVAARTIDAFGARLREQSDIDTLRRELLAVIDGTMQPAQASLWLRQGTRS